MIMIRSCTQPLIMMHQSYPRSCSGILVRQIPAQKASHCGGIVVYKRRDTSMDARVSAINEVGRRCTSNHRNMYCSRRVRCLGRKNVCRASSSSSPDGETPSSSSSQVTMPIFPLGIVALPAASCPLHIFEARYRVLFSTLLDGTEGIDQGLVSPEKPWRGSKRFGMAFYDQTQGGLASVGTVLEIQDHSSLDDGRMLIENIGRERFRIVEVVEEKPVLVAKVEFLTEDDDSAQETVGLAQDVAQLFKDVVQLSVKLKEADVEPEVMEPKELDSLRPRDLSFWVASLFAGSPYNQQALLEENDTVKRLTVEKELLENTLKYLSAQSALKSAFGGEGSSGVE